MPQIILVKNGKIRTFLSQIELAGITSYSMVNSQLSIVN